MNFAVKLLFALTIYDIQIVFGENRDWWKFTTIYEVYIRSFKDSDGDGIGDLKGITMMLDHFVDLKIETLWISPFFKSPMLDMGYDVADYLEIDPTFGTMADFEELLNETKKRGLKIMVDYVINHSSDEHEWFNKSVNRIEPYTDYYVWHNAKGFDKNKNPIPPNNWLSLFGGSAWRWNPTRKQFYLHQFAAKQPEFNLRNPSLKKELKNTLKFWFDKGVAGARLDASRHYMEDPQLRDETLIDPNKVNPGYYDYDHKYTTDLWECYEFIHELREFIDAHCDNKSDEKMLIVEAYTTLNLTMKYYGTDKYKIVHFPFNFAFVVLQSYPSPKLLDSTIKSWLDHMPQGGVANWVSENHDNLRTGTRFNEEFIDIMLITTMMLPGVACIYYGQEIGMLNNRIRPDQLQDPNRYGIHTGIQRDAERLPMQWDDSLNAGFTSNFKAWLPLNPNYWRVNVKTQKFQINSRYNTYKALSKLRQTNTLKYGKFVSHLLSSWVYAFSRIAPNEPTIITIINLGSETEMIHLHDGIPNLPSFMKVLAASVNAGYVRGKMAHCIDMELMIECPTLVLLEDPTSSTLRITLPKAYFVVLPAGPVARTQAY